MTHSRKQCACALIVMAWAIWPVAHFHIVQMYDINPWKLFGFAMYCTPHVVSVQLQSPFTAEHLDPDDLRPEVRAAYATFVRRRETLGKLHRPDELASALLRTTPSLMGLTVKVSVSQLNGLAAGFVTRAQEYRYLRSGGR